MTNGGNRKHTLAVALDNQEDAIVFAQQVAKMLNGGQQLGLYTANSTDEEFSGAPPLNGYVIRPLGTKPRKELVFML